MPKEEQLDCPCEKCNPKSGIFMKCLKENKMKLTKKDFNVVCPFCGEKIKKLPKGLSLKEITRIVKCINGIKKKT